MTAKINDLNWNTSYFHSDDLLAFVSIGAEPGIESVIQYNVTLSNKEYEDIYQSTHAELQEALKILNLKYGDWQFKDLAVEDSESGCSTCAAH